ncbi:MAG: transcriptional repressor [Oscillospiraceae bacterium]
MQPLRFSAQRELIFNTILNDKDHPTADAIYNKLKPTNPQLSLATVYRNLRQLEGKGDVIRISTQCGCDHYDARTDKHYHLYCKVCDKMFDIDYTIDTQIIEKAQEQSQHLVENYELYFIGKCKNCRETDKK